MPAEVRDRLRAAGRAVPDAATSGLFAAATADPSAPAAGPAPPGVIVPSLIWGRGRTVRVHFLDPAPVNGLTDRVESHVKKWSEVADVKFAFVTSAANSDVRVTFRRTDQFYSRLGREAEEFPGEHTMSLGFRPTETREGEFSRLILHEFGHALGLMHEHQHPGGGIRWDRPRALAYYRPRLPRGMTDDEIMAQLVALPASSRYKTTPFDPLSVMLYSIPEQVVEPGTWRPEFGNNNTRLSAGDAATVADPELYGPPDGPPPPPPPTTRELVVDGPALAGSIRSAGQVDRYTVRVPDPRAVEVSATGDAVVRVTLADGSGTPVPGDSPVDMANPNVEVRMLRLLAAGAHALLVGASPFAPGSRGDYTIRVRRAD
jgi:hypothetical protein